MRLTAIRNELKRIISANSGLRLLRRGVTNGIKVMGCFKRVLEPDTQQYGDAGIQGGGL